MTLKTALCCAVVMGAAGLANAQATKAPAANGNKPLTSAARAKASLEPLLQQGISALLAGQQQAAREAFLDAASVDPRNPKALHGLGLCYASSKDMGKAKDAMDKALLAGPPDRALAINAAALHMTIKSHMRAAKIVKDYLAAHPKDIDEPMVNALGAALAQATVDERRNRFYAECTAFYEVVNKKLEATRPGFKRFGSEWFAAAEVDAKMVALAGQKKETDRLAEDVAKAEVKAAAAAKELARQEDLIRRGGEKPGNGYWTSAKGENESAQSQLQTAKQAQEKFLASIEKPKFVTEIAMVPMTETAPPEVSKPPVAVADASGAGTAGAQPAAKKLNPKRPIEVVEKPAGSSGGGTATPASEPPMGQQSATAGTERPVSAPRKVRVTQYAAAFAIAEDAVVTTAAIVSGADEIQLQSADGQLVKATVLRKDEGCGLAVLKIEGQKLASLPLADAFAGGPISCAAFPTVDLFSPAAQVIMGHAQAPASEWTVSLNVHPRLAGSPLLAGGKVVGVCVAARDAEKQKLPAISLEQLKTFVGADAKAGRTSADPTGALLQVVATRESGE